MLTLNGNFYGSQGAAGRAGAEFTAAVSTAANEPATDPVPASENLQPLVSGTDTVFAPLTFMTTIANQNISLLIEGSDVKAVGTNYGPQINYDTFTLKDTSVISAVPELSPWECWRWLLSARAAWLRKLRTAKLKTLNSGQPLNSFAPSLDYLLIPAGIFRQDYFFKSHLKPNCV